MTDAMGGNGVKAVEMGEEQEEAKAADTIILVGKLVRRRTKRTLFREGSAYIDSREEEVIKEGPGRAMRTSRK